jgi:hypothetical protein
VKDVAAIIVPWAIITLALFALVDWDESRLDERSLERAWPPASRTLALVYFGMLALPIHFWRTRRSWSGFALGLGWAAGVLGLDWAVSEGIDALPESFMGPSMLVALAFFGGAMSYRAVKRSSHGDPHLMLPMSRGR